MAIVYGDLTSRILRLLEDPEQQSYAADIVLDAVRASINAILPWLPKQATTTLSSGSQVFAVPVDFYEAEAILDEGGKVVPRVTLSPSAYFGENVTGNSWLPYPYGSITFAKSLGADYTLYYLASWPLPTEQMQASSELEVPEIAEVALSYYGAAYCLIPEAISTGEIRQFATRADSGNPEHNPLQRSVDFLLRLWRDEMKRIPAFQKVG